MNEQFDSHDPEFVIDEMTGEQVRYDETIVFHGRRVGAEGKRLLMERLEAGDRLPGELQAPDWLKRLGCAILDSIILFAINLPLIFGLGALVGGGSTNSGASILALTDAIPGVIGLLYFGIGHAYYGRTVGKLAGRIKVVMQDGSPVTHKAGWLRSFIFAGLGLLLLPLYFLGDIGVGMVAIGSIGVGVFGLANAITVLAHPEKRAIHDLIAGTRVVEIG